MNWKIACGLTQYLLTYQMKIAIFLDTIYIPSKYPLGSALPDYNPDDEICQMYIKVAERILDSVKYLLRWFPKKNLPKS